jgi:hypothetical protein
VFEESYNTLSEIILQEEHGFTHPNFFTSPTIIPFATKIIDIAVSKDTNYSLFLDENSDCFIIGGLKNVTKTPKLILSGVKCIQGGINACVFFMKNGEVFVFGENSFGQLSSDFQHIPIISSPTKIQLPK